MELHSSAFDMTARELFADRTFVQEVVQRYPMAVEHASDQLRADGELLLQAARHNTVALQHAAVSLWSDKPFVLAAMKLHPMALELVSNELRSDREFMLAEIEHSDGTAMEHPEYAERVRLHAVSKSRKFSPAHKTEHRRFQSVHGLGATWTRRC